MNEKINELLKWNEFYFLFFKGVELTIFVVFEANIGRDRTITILPRSKTKQELKAILKKLG